VRAPVGGAPHRREWKVLRDALFPLTTSDRCSSSSPGESHRLRSGWRSPALPPPGDRHPHSESVPRRSGTLEARRHRRRRRNRLGCCQPGPLVGSFRTCGPAFDDGARCPEGVHGLYAVDVGCGAGVAHCERELGVGGSSDRFPLGCAGFSAQAPVVVDVFAGGGPAQPYGARFLDCVQVAGCERFHFGRLLRVDAPVRPSSGVPDDGRTTFVSGVRCGWCRCPRRSRPTRWGRRLRRSVAGCPGSPCRGTGTGRRAWCPTRPGRRCRW